MTRLEKEDIKRIATLPLHWEKLVGKTLLVSGATGFIGSFLCGVLEYRNEHYGDNIKVVSLSRRGSADTATVKYLRCDITEPFYVDGRIDYVIHLASNTHPLQYKEDPVGTITGNVFGCYYLLDLAKKKNVERFLLASSCEIYGNCPDTPVDESYSGYIDPNTARAGYNEAKRLSESLCQSFASQYGIDHCVCRFARVFGADKTKNDTKALAQFIGKAINGEDIVLKSKGDQKYSYIYVADAVYGLLAVLMNGAAGEAYNISADLDDTSLKGYAEYIASLSNRKVVIKAEYEANVSKAENALLDNKKAKSIGFYPIYSVKDGIKRTLDIYKGE